MYEEYKKQERESEMPHLLSKKENYKEEHQEQLPDNFSWANLANKLGYGVGETETLQSDSDYNQKSNEFNWSNLADSLGYGAGEPAPLQGKGLSDMYAATKHNRNPYSGKKLSVSGNMAENIQDSFGIDPSKISLRESSDVAKMGAKATAQGNVIRFAPGQFNPDTKEGQKVLGHELNHVREQAQGKVKANVEGTNIHFDSGHEASSDRAGEAFASGSMSSATPVSVGQSTAESAPVQGILPLLPLLVKGAVVAGKAVKAGKVAKAGKTAVKAGKTKAKAGKGKATQKPLTAAEKKMYKRPSGYRKNVRKNTWESAKGPDGVVRDPTTGRPMNFKDPWDMGHKPGHEFRKHQRSAAKRRISRKEFLNEHNNSNNYRPELPSSNRSHAGEDLTNLFLGP